MICVPSDSLTDPGFRGIPKIAACVCIVRGGLVASWLSNPAKKERRER